VKTLAEKIPSGPTCRVLFDLVHSKNMFLVFGLAERDGTGIYNSAAVIGPDGFVGKYRKTHLFAEEKGLFDPGDTGLQVFDIKMARIGIMICFDWWFPEAARVLALLGADVICHPANLVLPYCQQAMLTRALENGVFTVTANRVGTESRGGKVALTFTGGSQVVDNLGHMIAKLDTGKTGVAIAEIDVEKARDKKITAQDDRFKDRRPEFYGILARDL
jgi:predicted amidohydrolase